MVKVTIIDGNDEIELSTAPKENIKAYMIKGEPGSDGVSPTATISKSGSTTTITVTDKNGTTVEDVEDGYSPTVTTSKTNKITTLTIHDIDGTRTTQILDGVDLTGGVPTNAVIGFDGTASEIPNGYEVTTEPFPGAGSITVNDNYSTSTTEPYSANYVNNAIPTISDSYSTSITNGYSANYINNLNGKLLWTNTNQNASFSSQTVSSLNLANYDLIEVYSKNYASSSYLNTTSVRIPKGFNGYLNMIEVDGAVVNRQVIVNWTSNSITFNDAKFKSATSTTVATADNNRCIPIYIVGYKTNIF